MEPNDANESGAPVEAMLKRHRPFGPPDDLRDRVIDRAARRPRSCWAVTWWLSAAAILLVSFILQAAAVHECRQIAAMLGPDHNAWPPEAEAVVAMLGGDESARRYIAFALSADRARRQSPTDLSLTSMQLGAPQ